MNKKTLSAALLIAFSTTTLASAATVGDTSDAKLNKFQKQALELTRQTVAHQMAIDSVQPTALTLDLPTTIVKALENNYDVKSAVASYEQAQANVSAAGAAKNPSFSYGYNASRGDSTGSGTGATNSFSQTVSVALPVYTGGAAEGNLTVARLRREAAGAYVVQVEETTKLNAATYYFNLLMAHNKASIADQQVADLQGHVDNVNAQYNVGIVARTDVLASNVSLANAQTTRITAYNSVSLAEANLNNLLGLPVNTEITIADKEFTYTPYDVTLDQAEAYAMLHRAEVMQSALALQVSKEQIGIAESGYRPTVSVNASKGWKGDTFSTGDSRNWSMGAGLSWSLWDGGSTQANVKAAKASYIAQQQANSKNISNVMLDVRQAYLNMQEAAQTIKSTKVAVDQGEENFRIASIRYRAGVGTNLDVLDAELNLNNARTSYIEALYNYNTNVATLEKAMGVPVDSRIGYGLQTVDKQGAVEDLAQLTARAAQLQAEKNK